MAEKTETTLSDFGYPSHFVNPKVKEQKKFTLQYIKAMHGEFKSGGGIGIFRARMDEYAEWRALMNGNQSVDQYKPFLLSGTKHGRDGGSKNRDKLSYKVLDWSILAVAPKFKNVLIGRLIGQNNDIGIKAVDGTAINARRQKKIEMQEYIMNKDFYDEISAKTGIEFESPADDADVMPPRTLAEVDLYMDMFYKERYCLELMDWLKLVDEDNNSAHIDFKVATNLVEVGAAGTKVTIVGRRIKERSVIPERFVSNNCKENDLSDFQHGGEYFDVTIGELRELCQDQLSEKELMDIANKVVGANQWDAKDVPVVLTNDNRYPYDHVKVTIADFIYFSPDEEVYEIVPNKFGNVKVYEKSFDWMHGVSAESYNNDATNRKRQSTMVRRQLNNLYGGMWVVGTDHVFNYGKQKNMLRNESNIGTCIGPYMMYTTNFDALARQLKPVFHNIQLNWLQYQHHILKSRPSGLDIEYSALQNINIKGPNGTKMTPKEVLELYFDTGILLWRRNDAWGNANNWRPVNELQNGLNPAAAQHFQNIVNGIDLLRTILGMTELAAAETPNPETTKGAQELSLTAVDDSLRYLHHGFDQIKLGAAKRKIMHMSALAANGIGPDYVEALGVDSAAFLSQLAEMGAHEYGVYAMREPSEKMKQRILVYIQEGLATQSLTHSEAFEIENERNPYRAIRMMKVYEERKQQQKMKEAQAMYEMEKEKNIDSANATEQAKRDTLQLEAEIRMQEAPILAQSEILKNQELIRDQILLEKVKQNGTLTLEEKKRVTALMVEDKRGHWKMLEMDKKIAEQKIKEKNKPKPASGKK